jgi:hypothetical protein
MDQRSRLAIEEFARAVGVPARFNARNQSAFDFNMSGKLTFTPDSSEQGIVMSLTRNVISTPSQQRDALAMAGYDENMRMTLMTGLNERNNIVLALSIKGNALTGQRLMEYFEFLKRKQKMVLV